MKTEILQSITFLICKISLLYIGKQTKSLLLQFSTQLCSLYTCFHVCVVMKLRQEYIQDKNKNHFSVIPSKNKFSKDALLYVISDAFLILVSNTVLTCQFSLRKTSFEHERKLLFPQIFKIKSSIMNTFSYCMFIAQNCVLTSRV